MSFDTVRDAKAHLTFLYDHQFPWKFTNKLKIIQTHFLCYISALENGQDEDVPSSEDDDVSDLEDAEASRGSDKLRSSKMSRKWSCCCFSERKFWPKSSTEKQQKKAKRNSLLKNTSVKNKFMPKNCLLISRLTIRNKTHYKKRFFREFIVSYSESGLYLRSK